MAARPVTLQTHDLGVTRGSTTVLKGIDLCLVQGETVAVLGANGAGKSTLAQAFVGLVRPTSGRVRVHGADIAGRRRDVPWHRIGYVPQRVGATTGVPTTAMEVVAAGLLHRRALRPGRHARRKRLEALDHVRLGERAHTSVQVLSGGQQQRVLIARALVRDADLLVLDEPLAGMDRDSMEALATTIATLRQRGTTVVVVLHDLGPLAGLIDRSVVLHAGRVVHDAPLPPHRASGAGAVASPPRPAAPLPIPRVPELQTQR